MTTEQPSEITVVPIGYVSTSVPDPSRAAPQASDATDLTGRVLLRPDVLDGLLGLERYPFVWLVTWLHEGAGEPPPLRLVPRATEATGEVQGVFASRAPRRPNPIGLSLVRLLGVADDVLTFAGVDLVDGTPVLDLKPWFADCDRPSGDYHTLTPRLVVADVEAQVELLRRVFDGTGEVQPGRPAEIRIGDSLVLVTSTDEREPFPAFLYVYVDDADQTYRRAVDAGLETLEAPLDTPYGDRRAMVRDRSGNVFQVAHRLPR